MFQVIFNDTSAAEMSALPKELQLQILSEFNFLPKDLEQMDSEKFGKLAREGRQLFRYRTKDYRIYFEAKKEALYVHRVLHRNSLKDFLYRSKLPTGEDETLQKSAEFWEMIDGRR